MTINIRLDVGAKTPTKAHSTDAGYDIYTPVGKTIYPHMSITIDSGVHVEIPKGYVGMLKSKSGLNVNHGIVSEGVIDSGYTGSIVVKLYNHSDEPYEFKPGDKITQLVIMPILMADLLVVDEFVQTERGDNGFGSSGR